MFVTWQVRLCYRKKYGYLGIKITRIMITKESNLVIAPFYRRYVEPIHTMPLAEAFQEAEKQSLDIIDALPEKMGEFRYQPEKWTIKEVFCHMLDTERIMAYRALRFARNDKTPLHGFEENNYAPEANANYRRFAEIRNELTSLRKSTVDLFASFTEEMMVRTGQANGAENSVRAYGYIIAGHALHHCRILVERYSVSPR